MEIVYLLVALSTVLVLAIIIVLWWAVEHDQFAELDSYGRLALEEDGAPEPPLPN
jgi:cbb3-type cytochrome oxidase maturation protein